jgi:hypothetical protein
MRAILVNVLDVLGEQFIVGSRKCLQTKRSYGRRSTEVRAERQRCSASSGLFVERGGEHKTEGLEAASTGRV